VSAKGFSKGHESSSIGHTAYLWKAYAHGWTCVQQYGQARRACACARRPTRPAHEHWLRRSAVARLLFEITRPQW